MKPFGKLFKHNSSSAPNTAEATETNEWDQLATDEKEKANTRRQQDKVIATIVTGDPNILAQPSADIPENAHEEFVQAIAENRVTDDHWNFVLSNIVGPIDRKSPAEIFSNMENDNHQKRILAYSLGLNPNNIENIDANNLTAFEQHFPSPMAFEDMSNRFLNMLINANNSERKIAEYEKSMADFKHAIYGKKQEYWESIKKLQEEASELSTPNTQSNPLETEASNFNPEAYLKAAKIVGDPYKHNGDYYQLTTDLLEQAGLAPTTEIEMNGKKIALSKVFDMGSHPACIAYVSSEKGVKVCTYYQSSSSGSWRFMPDYVEDSHWIGKGYNEESLTLPFAMQKELTELSEDEHVPIDPVAAKFIFYGTGKSYPDIETYRKNLNTRALRGDSYQESSNTPIATLSPELTQVGKLVRSNPESIGTELLDSSFQPDFKQALDSYNMHTKLYGDVTVKKYPSENGKLSYIMCETVINGKREAWLSSVETETDISTSGTPKEWVSGGVLATPLYEYNSMSVGYGNHSDMRGSYTNMWDNYLSKIPFIQKYLKDTEM